MRHAPWLLLTTFLPATSPVWAQQPLTCGAGPHYVEYDGQVRDYLVPNLPGRVIQVEISGADGGLAHAGPDAECSESGGQGGHVSVERLGQLFGCDWPPLPFGDHGVDDGAHVGR